MHILDGGLLAGPVILDDDLLIEGDNAAVLPLLPDGAFDCIYIDPPFNTGRTQRRATVSSRRDDVSGSHVGFGGALYHSQVLRALAYEDEFSDYLGFLAPRLVEARRLLAPHGTLYFHIDYREAHYCKLLLDEIFGRGCFLNEIIWAYDYGGKTKRRWPAKHDTILVYVKDPERYHFDGEEVDREPYMAPGLVTADKAERGKLPTDCYSDDTEVLTDRGWLPFNAVSYNDQLASVTPDHELVYSTPTRLHRIRYRGQMVSLKTKSIDLLVTPNHSLFVRPKNATDFEFRPAEDLIGSRFTYFSLSNQLRWSGEPYLPTFDVPPVDYSRAYCAKPLPQFALGDWCELMGWYLSEGSTLLYRDRTEVHITQTKDAEKIARIGDLLERMGIHAHYNGHSHVVCNKQLTAYLAEFGKAHEKYVPRELLKLPRPFLQRLMEGLMLGDGSVKRGTGNRRESWVYLTTSERLAADVQELFIKLGYSATVRRQSSGNPNWRTSYVVQRRASRESTLWPERHRGSVSYDGHVYCATVVPHHTLVVRRNGRPAVCGNCWWHTIVPTNSHEKTGYPTQKPEGIVRRMVSASSRPGGWCLDFFAGSGTLGAVCQALGRRFVLVDSNPEAVAVARRRLMGEDERRRSATA